MSKGAAAAAAMAAPMATVMAAAMEVVAGVAKEVECQAAQMDASGQKVASVSIWLGRRSHP